jgi:O-antigen/teichoic acid export membrane protein
MRSLDARRGEGHGAGRNLGFNSATRPETDIPVVKGDSTTSGDKAIRSAAEGATELADSVMHANAAVEKHFATDHLRSDLKGRTISSAFITITAQGAKLILTLVSTMVLARLLTPLDFGLVAMVMTVTGFLRIFKDAGLSTATIQRDKITHAQVSNLFWINVALSGLISLVMAACSPMIAWFFREPRLVGVTLILSISFLLTGATVQHMALLNRQMRFKVIALIEVGSMLVSVAVGVGMAWLKYGYWSLVGFQLSLPFAALLLTWSTSTWRPQLPVRRGGTRSFLRFGANLTASSFIYSLAGGADSLLIGRYYGLDPVGLYSRAGALLRRPLEQLLSPINAVFIPVLSMIQDQPDRYRSAFLRVYEAVALIGAIVSGLSLALARPLTLVALGPKWEGVVVIFGGFAISALFNPLAATCSWLLESQGRGRDMLLTSGIISGVAICSFVIGLPFGPAGVAIAYSIFGILVQLPFYFHITGRSGPVATVDLWVGFVRHLPVWGIVCGASFLTLTLVVGRPPWLQLLICVPAGLLAGGALMCFYPPSRRTALSLLDALREFTVGRGKSILR